MNWFHIALAIFGPWMALVSSKYGEYIEVKPFIVEPVFERNPFALVWNVNNTDCPLGDLLDRFGFLHNNGFGVEESDQIAIFYVKDFPDLPRFDRKTGKPISGGLPQNGNLTNLATDFGRTVGKLPDDFHGLGVIDWEAWTALFNRLNSTVYQKKSIASVKKRFPHLKKEEQEKFAKFEYETATRSLMKTALEVGKISRPRSHWGFYLYPDCRRYNTTAHDYHCNYVDKWQNDRIQWLFDSSTAIFPSVYFPKSFQDQDFAIEYVAGRIREAMRVEARRWDDVSIPVFSYHMLSYKKDVDELLDVYDLINSIGVASVLGGSGVIIWGGDGFVNTPKKCQKIHDYLENVLGPFCAKMASNALKCSMDLCSGHGRCVVASRRGGEKPTYLTEAEAVQLIGEFKNEAYNIYEALLMDQQPGDEDRALMHCHCYPGWVGRHCEYFDGQ